MEIKYFIRTTGDRILDKSLEQIDYELIIDKSYKPVESFVNALFKCDSYNCVILEDDVILCKDFKNRIESVIKSHPADLINFYTKPLAYFQSTYSFEFHYNQCTYFPKGMSSKLAEQIMYLKTNYILNPTSGYDVYARTALEQLRIPHLMYRPCLVQHNDLKSLISKSSPDRITPWFIDYLDNLNIDYNSKEAILSIKSLLYERNKHLNIDPTK